MSAVAADGWRLPDDACALLHDLVMAEKPALVLEAGSGRSTVVLAEALAELAVGGPETVRLVSLEHVAEYAAETRLMLRAAGLSAWAEVRGAPLERHGHDLACARWYAAHAWADLIGIGMLVVDGPPGGANRFARLPAVPLLGARLQPRCLVVLDDANRKDEQTALAEWRLSGVRRFAHAKATFAYGRIRG